MIRSFVSFNVLTQLFCQVSNLCSCIKMACDFLCAEGIAWSAAVTEEFRRGSMLDVLQLRSMLWHSWVSLGSQRSHQANRPLMRAQAKRKRSQETPRGQDDAARRKKRKALRDDTVPTPSPNVYKCPHADCDGRDRIFIQAQGVFSHL